MRDNLYPEMFEMEQRHWWFRAKHRVVMSLLARYVGKTGRVADLGCGCGMMPFKLQQAGYGVVGLDMSDDAIAFAAQRGVKVLKGGLPAPIPFATDEKFDAVLMLDVLEHLEHDVASAKAAADLLKPGGALICTVPAYQWLYSQRDTDHQHFRRYAKKQYRALFEIPTLRIELLSHYNFWLFPLAAGARLASKLLPAKPGGDLHVPPAPLNAALYHTMASERAALGRVTLPWGLSLVSVARRV
jgi:SAM-dependent methyltransferase